MVVVEVYRPRQFRAVCWGQSLRLKVAKSAASGHLSVGACTLCNLQRTKKLFGKRGGVGCEGLSNVESFSASGLQSHGQYQPRHVEDMRVPGGEEDIDDILISSQDALATGSTSKSAGC